MIEEIIANKVISIFSKAEQAHEGKHWHAVMKQKELCEYLGNIDPKTLKQDYIYQPDFPTIDTNTNRLRWSKAAVDRWLEKHSVPFKEVR